MFRKILPLLLTAFIDSLGFGIVLPLLPTLVIQPDSALLPDALLSVKGLFFGLIITTFCLGQFFGGPMLGAISDRYGRKKVLCASIAIGAVSYLLGCVSILIGSITLFLIARIFQGIASANFSIAQAMVVDLSSEEQKRNNFGLVGMAWGVGFILGPCLGGFFSEQHTLAFFFSSMICLLNLGLIWLFVEESLLVRKKSPWSPLSSIRDMKRAFTHPNLKGVFLTTFIFSLGWGFFTEFSPITLMDRFSFGPRQIGNFYAYAGIWIAVCQGLLIRPLVKKFAPAQLLRISLLFMGINLLLFMGSREAWILFIAVPLISLPEAMIYPNTAALISSLSNKDEQGEMLGIHNSVQWSSIGILPLFSGALVANYPLMPIIFSSAMLFVALSVFQYYYKRLKAYN
jgi:DHA1 family tetracycline resistance protein-like MFS transporter